MSAGNDGLQRDNETDEQIEELVPIGGEESGGDEQTADMTADSLVVVKKRSRPFQKFKRRFPSYKLVSNRFRKKEVDDKEQRQPLNTSETCVCDEDEYNRRNKDTMSPTLMNRLSDPKECIDPSKYPLEQVTDAEYGRNDSYHPVDLGTDHSSSLKRQKKRKIIVIISVISILLIIIGIVIGVTAKRNPSATGQDPSKNVPEPPSDLENICSIRSMSTQSGYNKCEEVCDVVKCCRSGGNKSKSCPVEFEDVCGRYTPCEILQSHQDSSGVEDAEFIPHSGVARASDHLGSFCSDASIAEPIGFNLCQSSCLAGECCVISGSFESQELTSDGNPTITQPCGESHEDICRSYTPCMSILGVKSTTDLVNQKCTADNVHYLEGQQDCELFCKPRNCCFAKLQKENCALDNKLWCDEYKACQVLESSSIQSSIGGDKNSDLVNSLCTYENIRYIEGREKCESICLQRKCCLSEEESCRENTKSWCDEFKACAILSRPSIQSSGGSDDEAENLLGIEKCNNFSTLSPFEIDDCIATCDNCCFYDDTECDVIDCSQYQFCGQIKSLIESSGAIENESGLSDNQSYPQTGGPIGGKDGLQPGPLPKQVNVACANDNLNECYYLCSPYLCCFYDTYDPLSCHAKEICAKYSSCSVLIDPDALSGSAMDGDDSNRDEGLYPADEICSIDNLSMNHGLQQCEALCTKHRCCFGGAEACTYRNDCPIYQACGILTDKNLLIEGPKGPLIFNFDSICSLDSLKTIGGQNACINICKPYECCATGKCESLGFCDMVAACGNLYSGEIDDRDFSPSRPIILIDSIPPPVDLKQFCSVELITSDDLFRITKCIEFCQVAEICREECEERFEECEERLRFCDNYVTCHTVWEVDNLNKQAAKSAPGAG